jgi:hypothetical protein
VQLRAVPRPITVWIPAVRPQRMATSGCARRQRFATRGGRWSSMGRVGHAERRRPAAHPVHGHLRPRPGVHDLALPGPGHAAAGRREPHLRGRELQWRGLRRWQWRRDLRARRAFAHRPLHVRGEPNASGAGRTSEAERCARSPTTTPSRLRSPAAVSQPTCAATAARGAASGCHGTWRTADSSPTERSAIAQTRLDPERRAAAAAARSTTTATASGSRSEQPPGQQPRDRGRRCDLLRQQRPQRHARDQGQRPAAQSKRRISDRRSARHLLPGRRPARDRRLRAALSGSDQAATRAGPLLPRV